MNIQNNHRQSFKAAIINPQLTEKLTELSASKNRLIANRANAAINVIKEATNSQKSNHKVNLFIDFGSIYIGKGKSFEKPEIIQNTTKNFKEIYVADKVRAKEFLRNFVEKVREISEKATAMKK